MADLRPSRRWIVAALVTLLAVSVLAGSVVAGQFRGADPEAVRADLATGEIVRIADIAAGEGFGSRGVFAQTTEMGQLCLWDAPAATSRQRQGGCNPSDDPLGGMAVSASLAYNGGPNVRDVRDARLIGLAAPNVASIQVLLSDGTRRNMRLRTATIGSDKFQAFGYRFKSADLRKGVGPDAVVALDGSGAEIARQPTGIGG